MTSLRETVTPVHREGALATPTEGVTITSRAPHQASLKTIESLARRLSLVLGDLGLDRRLSGWINAAPEGLTFADLNVRDADALVLALEDHVAGGRTRSSSPDPTNQLTLF